MISESFYENETRAYTISIRAVCYIQMPSRTEMSQWINKDILILYVING